jgi:pre-mRNA-splicing factor SYF1
MLIITHFIPTSALWCEYVEMELRNGEFARARTNIQRACTVPANYKILLKEYKTKAQHGISAHQLLFKQLRIWQLYADIEESLGTFLTTKAVYDRIIDLRIASPQLILNYAAYLEEHNFFEEAFQVYERGVDIFKFPHSLDIWVTYLSRFIQRYVRQILHWLTRE